MRKIVIFFFLLIGANSAGAQTITLGPISKLSYCVYDTFRISYSASGTFAADNQFNFQVSDSSGSFASFSNFGSGSALQGSFVVGSAIAGDDFRVRVVATDPKVISDTSPAFQVYSFPIPKAWLVIGIKRLFANATDSTSGPAVMVDQQAKLFATANPAAETFNWTFDGDASISSDTGVSVTVSYPTAGLKTGTLRGVNSLGCGASINFAIRVLECHPTIPKNAHIVTGFEAVGDTFVWVKSGAVDSMIDSLTYPQTIYVEPGGYAFGTQDVGWNTFYLKSGASINHLPETGTVINCAGIRDTFEAQVPADTLSCDNLDFDYSQVLAGVAENPSPTLSLIQFGDHLFANSEETPAEIRIMNILGAEVLSQHGTGALDVDLAPLPAGVYFALVQSGDAREVKKIAVVH